jgi:hypothetical protein
MWITDHDGAFHGHHAGGVVREENNSGREKMMR